MRIGNAMLAFLGLATITPLALAPQTARGDAPFFTETIEVVGGTGIRVAVDNAGRPHVVYWDLSNQFLVYATRNNGTWMIEVAAAQGFVGQDADIAVDAQGVPHVSFHNFTPSGIDELFYAHRTGGVWTVEPVDATANDVGKYSAIAIDSQGRPHISYYDETVASLKYATKSGVWSVSFIATIGLVGKYTNIALDLSDRPHVAYWDESNLLLMYARKSGSSWVLEPITGSSGEHSGLAVSAAGNPFVCNRSGGYVTVYSRDATGWLGETLTSTGDYSGALAVDAEGHPHIVWQHVVDDELWYSAKRDTGWAQCAIHLTGSANTIGEYNDVALDAYGNPVVVYSDDTNGDALYADAGVRLSTPLSGVTWPVGAERTVAWRGAGKTDILLSTDGGASYSVLASGLQATGSGGQYTFTVPHRPSRFCKLKLERKSDYNYSATVSDSLFTIETDIALLNFVVSIGDLGNTLSWSTNPGPADIAGYRVARGRDGLWSTIVSLTRSTTHTDAAGRDGDNYRLFAVNGLGQEFLIGNARAGITPSIIAIDAYPNPFSSGELTVTFATAGGLGGGKGPASVTVYDVAGRLVRTIANGAYDAGTQRVRWDGRDGNGTLVASGAYFIRAANATATHSTKVMIVR